MLQEMEIGAFGDRARRELAAASGVRRARPPRIPCIGDALTEQETQIARLAQAGLSNPEIGSPAVHQRAHRPVPLGQGVHEAGHHLAQPAAMGAVRPPGAGSGLGRHHGQLGRPAQFAGGCIVRHIIPVKISSLIM